MKTKVLVVDDNKAVRTALRLVLSPHFDTVATGDPQLIPALIAPGNVDALLLDMNFGSDRLDGSDGLFWLDAVMQRPEPPAVLMITAFGELPLAVEAMRRGALDFITKPWDNDVLVARIREAVGRSREARRLSREAGDAGSLRLRESERASMTLDELKRAHAEEAVGRCGGNLAAAARQLGINRQTLYNILRRP